MTDSEKVEKLTEIMRQFTYDLYMAARDGGFSNLREMIMAACDKANNAMKDKIIADITNKNLAVDQKRAEGVEVQEAAAMGLEGQP